MTNPGGEQQAAGHEEPCQYIVGWKRYDLRTHQVVDPPEPEICERPEQVPWLNPWSDHVGPLGHAYTRVGQHHDERYRI